MAYRIMLDAGHGGDDPGAVYKDHTEKDDNLRLTMELGKILEDNGIEVIYTRTSDTFETPFERAQTANNSEVDYLISIHRNDSPLPNQYSGTAALVYDTSGSKLNMAEDINASLTDIGFENLGVHARPGLIILRRTAMPAILLEVGFINNDYDNDLFDDSLDSIAQAVANGILETLNPENIPQTPENQNSSSSREVSGSTFSHDDWDEEYIDTDGEEADLQGGTQSRTIENDSQLYRVQVGLFQQRKNADKLSYELLEKGYPAFILNEDGYYKVQVGAYRHLGNAIIMEQRLRKDGYTTLITM